MKTNNNLKIKIITGVVWKSFERIGVQGINFLVQVILTRILFPEDYATIAIITVFIVIADVFVNSGLNSALIQRIEIDDKDCSSVFYINILISIITYILIYIGAPLLSYFYNQEVLVMVLRVQGIVVIIGAFRSIQNTILTRNMQFKKSFYISLFGVISSGTVGISMAYLGFGVWALVFSQLVNAFITTIMYWILVGWKPKAIFSIERIQSLYSFGWKMFCISLINIVYDNLRTLIIAKLFTKETLGYYNRGNNLPQLLSSSITTTLSTVLLPALVTCQNDKSAMKALARRSISLTSFIIFPAMIGFIVVAKSFTLLVYTEKWLPCVPFMQIGCLGYMLLPIHVINLQVITAIGRSDLYLKLELIKDSLALITILISIPFGVYGIAVSSALFSLIAIFINSWPNRSLIHYSFIEQWKDILPSLLLSVTMGIGVWSLNLLPVSYGILLPIQILTGILIYIGGSILFQIEAFQYLKSLFQEYRK